MKTTKLIPTLLPLLALALSACSPAGISTAGSTSATDSSADVATLETFSDPYIYCAAVGQIDAPDSRYTGPQMSNEFFHDYLMAARLDPSFDYPEAFKKMTVWRCMDGKVYACNFGANIPCNSKANTDKTSTQAMIDYCKQFPGDAFIPMSVTGHSVIYSWHCVKDVPEILDQIDTVDAAGYQASFWQLVEPLDSTSQTPSPVADQGTPSVVNDGQIVFYSNRTGGHNQIDVFNLSNGRVTQLTGGDNPYFSGPFSPDGRRIVFTGFGVTHSYIGVMEATGISQYAITNTPGSDDAFPAWSPDGRKIAFTSNRDGNNEIYVMNEDGSELTRLTNNPTDDFAPAWSPDGSQIAFVSDRDNATGIYSIYSMNADGSSVNRLTNDKGSDYTPAWSPDGNLIAFRSVQNGQSDIYLINLDGSGLVNLTDNPAEDWSPAWSSDGVLLAFQTNRDGNWEIYVMDANGSNPINLTNNAADDQLPYWRP